MLRHVLLRAGSFVGRRPDGISVAPTLKSRCAMSARTTIRLAVDGASRKRTAGRILQNISKQARLRARNLRARINVNHACEKFAGALSRARLARLCTYAGPSVRHPAIATRSLRARSLARLLAIGLLWNKFGGCRTPMFADAKNYVKRKVRKLDYRNVHLPDGYDQVLAEYKRVRDDLDMISAIVKSLSHYEFGGQFFRQFASVSNIMASKSKIKALKREDMYTDAARVGEHMAESIESPSLKSVSRQFSEAWVRISESKVQMNARLSDAHSSVGELKKKAKSIDDKRNRVAALRYDLEEAAQAGEPTDTRMKDEYNTSSEAVLGEMKEFLGDAGLSGILKKVCSAYKEFSAASADSLSKMK